MARPCTNEQSRPLTVHKTPKGPQLITWQKPGIHLSSTRGRPHDFGTGLFAPLTTPKTLCPRRVITKLTAGC